MENETIEKYGVELEALTEPFKKQMQDLIKDTQRFGDEMKDNLDISPDVDFDIDEIFKKVNELQKVFKKIGFDVDMPDMLTSNYDKQIAYMEQKIDELKEGMQEFLEKGEDFDLTAVDAEFEKLNNQLDALYKKKALSFNTEEAEQQIEILEEKLRNFQLLLDEIDKGDIDFHTLGVDANYVEEIVNRLSREIKITKDNMKELNNTSRETTGIFSNLGNNISKGFASVNRNIKRVTLSMVGVHSAYMILSRAVSTYAQYDVEYTRDLEGFLIALGDYNS